MLLASWPHISYRISTLHQRSKHDSINQNTAYPRANDATTVPHVELTLPSLASRPDHPDDTLRHGVPPSRTMHLCYDAFTCFGPLGTLLVTLIGCDHDLRFTFRLLFPCRLGCFPPLLILETASLIRRLCQRPSSSPQLLVLLHVACDM